MAKFAELISDEEYLAPQVWKLLRAEWMGRVRRVPHFFIEGAKDTGGDVIEVSGAQSAEYFAGVFDDVLGAAS